MNTPYSDFQSGGRLIFNDITAERGGNILFSELSFTLSPGEVLWVQGTNGIGKTTLLRIAAGLTPPQTGYVNLIQGKNKMRQRPSTMICYQGHNDGFKAAMTAKEELSFWAQLYNFKGNIDGVLLGVSLSDNADVPTGKLSAGQKRRLALARLLISQRCIWILDEPNAAMDDEGRALTESLISQHIDHGGSVLVASHSEAKSLGPNARRLVLETAA